MECSGDWHNNANLSNSVETATDKALGGLTYRPTSLSCKFPILYSACAKNYDID